VLHRRVLAGHDRDAFSLEQDVWPHARLAARPIDGDFVDIGTFETLDAFRERMGAHATVGTGEPAAAGQAPRNETSRAP
jgi:hypothetical protein